MEAVAATASIAAILSLVGKTTVGIEELLNLCSGISSAFKITDKFTRDVHGLLKTLHDIKGLVENVPTTADTCHVASLQIQLEDCAKDVPSWLAAVVKESLPSSSNGTTAYLQRVKIAMNRKKTEKIRIEMNRSRAALITSLAVLGRWLDINTHHHVQEVKGQVETFSKGVLDIFEVQEAAIGRIERHTQSSMSSSASSNFTLESINSSLSELKSNFESFTNTWRPNAAQSELLADKGYILHDSVRASLDYDTPRAPDGLYHCPYAASGDCSHKPEKLRLDLK
ncbi:MAG: hypothetical protein Q9208_005212 [Pyrenodesmia sp. 3 TL-2023]